LIRKGQTQEFGRGKNVVLGGPGERGKRFRRSKKEGDAAPLTRNTSDEKKKGRRVSKPARKRTPLCQRRKRGEQVGKRFINLSQRGGGVKGKRENALPPKARAPKKGEGSIRNPPGGKLFGKKVLLRVFLGGKKKKKLQ